MASVYSYRGGKTASGNASRPEGLTAAHRSLPFGSKVRVTIIETAAVLLCGSMIAVRLCALTPAGARQLGFSGLAPVSLERIGG